MPFLDAWIDNSDDKLKLNTCRKSPTLDDISISKVFSPSPQAQFDEESTAQSFSMCNSYNFIHDDFQKIIFLLKSNGYPL